MLKEAKAVWVDKTEHTLPEKPAKRFSIGSMCLWCGLSSVFYVVFFLLHTYLEYRVAHVNAPMFVGSMQYMRLLIGDIVFWKAFIRPL